MIKNRSNGPGQSDKAEIKQVLGLSTVRLWTAARHVAKHCAVLLSMSSNIASSSTMMLLSHTLPQWSEQLRQTPTQDGSAPYTIRDKLADIASLGEALRILACSWPHLLKDSQTLAAFKMALMQTVETSEQYSGLFTDVSTL